MMLHQTNLFLAVEEVVSWILIHHKMTFAQFNWLHLILQSDFLDEEHQRSIQRVFYALKRKRLILISSANISHVL